jgi:5-methylcytosine-specific restriction protein A
MRRPGDQLPVPGSALKMGKGWNHERSRHERGYGSSWDRLRIRILKRDCGLCQPCLQRSPEQVTLATEVHHKLAKADGGTDDPDNLVSICHRCHYEASIIARGGTPKPPEVRVGLDGYPIPE